MFEEIAKALHYEIDISMHRRILYKRKRKRALYRQVLLQHFDGNGKKTTMEDLYYSVIGVDAAWELWHDIHRKRRRIAKRRLIWRWQIENQTKQESHNTRHR